MAGKHYERYPCQEVTSQASAHASARATGNQGTAASQEEPAWGKKVKEEQQDTQPKGRGSQSHPNYIHMLYIYILNILVRSDKSQSTSLVLFLQPVTDLLCVVPCDFRLVRKVFSLKACERIKPLSELCFVGHRNTCCASWGQTVVFSLV